MSLQTLLEQIKELEVLSHLPDRLCSAFLGNQLPSLDTKCKPKCTAVFKYSTVIETIIFLSLERVQQIPKFLTC